MIGEAYKAVEKRLLTAIHLRFGLPPDRLVRLRFDFGFAPDQWGVFFKFNEAF